MLSLSTCVTGGETFIFAVWHGDTLTVNSAETGNCIAARKIPGIRSCALLPRSGRACLGFCSGQLAVVNISTLIRQKEVKLMSSAGNKQRVAEIAHRFTDYFSNSEPEGAGDVSAPPRAQITRDGEIIALQTLEAAEELCAGCCSDGSFFVYDVKNSALIHRTAPGHAESVFAVVPHPSFPEIAATVSADATVRVWRETAGELRMDAWAGGVSQTGALFSGCWDPRPRSSLMLCGGFSGAVALVDVWRGSVRRLAGHEGCVLDVAWTGVPACLGCSVSRDGVGRLHAFDRAVTLADSKDAEFDVSANSVEFVRLGVPVSGCAFYEPASLLALACGDGYVRVYDIRLFGESREAVIAYYAAHGITGAGASVVEPIQVGKFSASSGPLFRVAFHPTLRGVLGVTADSGEVKVYRFDYSGA